MNRIKFTPAIWIVILLLSGSGCMDESATHTKDEAHTAEASVKYLRCEYRVNPLGIDVAKPRLSWILQSGQRAQVQSAYQVLVAASEENLEQNKGDLWNSSKVKFDQSNQVVYKGKPLTSRMRCCWKVRVWDKDDKVSAWSEPAMWTVGLLEPGDWQAKWIGYDAEPPAFYKEKKEPDPLNLEGCKWVWFDEGKPQKNAPIGTRFFRRNIEIAAAKKIKQARFRLIADNEAILFVNGREIKKVSGWQTAHTLDITDKLAAGANTLAIAATNQGDTTNPAGLAGKLLIEFETGRAKVVSIDRLWKASNTEQDDWQKPDFDDDNWPDAKQIAQLGDQPWGKPSQNELILPPPPYLRKTFVVNPSAKRQIKRATVYASALGLYELNINGKRVGGDYFTPGWTDYTKRVYYQSYDVTNLLARSGNVIGAILADGWYAGYLGFGRKREHYGSKLRLFVQLEIEYTDGDRQTVATDKSWKAAYGPILESDFLMGETYDSRKEVRDWCSYWFNDSAWGAVDVTDKIEGKLQPYPGVTVQKILDIDAKKLTEPKKGVYVFDMGQNFAGWVRLKVAGEAGTKVVLRFAEMLNPDGTVYTTNLREARCTDTYILKGDDEETWEPRFTFHGFRYVEVTGYPGKPALDAVTGIVLHSATPLAGAFECSNPMVNQLFKNIVWSQRGCADFYPHGDVQYGRGGVLHQVAR